MAIKKENEKDANKEASEKVKNIFNTNIEKKIKDYSKLPETTKVVSCRFKFSTLENLEEVAKRAGLERSDVIKIAVSNLLDDIRKNKLEPSDLLKLSMNKENKG